MLMYARTWPQGRVTVGRAPRGADAGRRIQVHAQRRASGIAARKRLGDNWPSFDLVNTFCGSVDMSEAAIYSSLKAPSPSTSTS